LAAEGNMSVHTIRNWKGENTIAFVRQMPNGLYIGLLTPKGPFYESVTDMMRILCILGVTLATALVYILVRTDRAKKKSDAESKLKSAFLANMSHEMRTPMNAIIGMTSIGLAATDAVQTHYCFEKIDNASKHLLGVINDVLDMSKIEADKLELSPASFDFEKMLQKVVNVIAFRIDERRQKFYVTIDKDIPCTLIGDDHRLSQVVTNLLSNAVKFTPEDGTITLDSRLVSEEDGICNLEVSVSDTGIGITDEQKERLFLAFEQAEADTSRKFGGTGLGLAISRRIMEMMGGDIAVESEPGRGSIFTVSVPLKRDDSGQKPGYAENIDWESIRIFAVDDEPEIRKLFIDISTGLHSYCKVAANAEEALEIMAREEGFDIYFVDWKLPGMDGIELARTILKESSHKPAVILISSTDWSLIESDAGDAGVDRFLPKPLFRSDIINIITECIGAERTIECAAADDECTDFAGHTILVAEDVDINREILVTLLEPTRLSVDCAENGAQAVEMFEADPDKYGMIFMDVQMPVMDGFEATRRIRASDMARAKEIPIAAMTANVFREDIDRCLEAGMNAHIGKPIDFDAVLQTLRTYL